MEDSWPSGTKWLRKIFYLVLAILVWNVATGTLGASKATNLEDRVLLLEKFRMAEIKAWEHKGFPWKAADAK